MITYFQPALECPRLFYYLEFNGYLHVLFWATSQINQVRCFILIFSVVVLTEKWHLAVTGSSPPWRLSVCLSDSKITQKWILIGFSGNVDNGSKEQTIKFLRCSGFWRCFWPYFSVMPSVFMVLTYTVIFSSWLGNWIQMYWFTSRKY